MQINKMFFGPFVQGIIRVATRTTGDAQGESRLQFLHEFEVLSRHHDKEGAEASEGEIPKLAAHPIADALREEVAANKGAGKLVEIPIRLFFNKPDNAVQARYQAYDADGRPVCSGNGDCAKRTTRGVDNQIVVSEVPCPGAEMCDYAASGQANCRRQVSMDVQIAGQDNPLSVFQVRTSSYHSYKALRAQVHMINHQFGGLRHVPLKLQMWKSSNKASEYEAFDLVCLALDASSAEEAMKQAKAAREAETNAGIIGSFDEVFEPLMADAELNQAGDEFDVVSDFYEVRPTVLATRRAGTSAPAAPRAADASATASAVLASAVKSAKAAARAAEPMETN